MTPADVEYMMSVVAVLTNLHWLPQSSRLIRRKHSDDFSLWTTVILMGNNLAWWFYAAYIGSPSLLLQQGLTICMLLVFAGLIIKYRTTPLFFDDGFKERWTRRYHYFVVYGVVFPITWLFISPLYFYEKMQHRLKV
jgi:uncharacterized protein with PQ loop repeat